MFVFGDAVPFLVGALPLFLFGWYFAIVPFGAVLRLCSFFLWHFVSIPVGAALL